MALNIPSLTVPSGYTLTNAYGRISEIDLGILAQTGRMTLGVHPDQSTQGQTPAATYDLWLGQTLSNGYAVPTLAQLLATAVSPTVTCATIQDAYNVVEAALYQIWLHHPAMTGATIV